MLKPIYFSPLSTKEYRICVGRFEEDPQFCETVTAKRDVPLGPDDLPNVQVKTKKDINRLNWRLTNVEKKSEFLGILQEKMQLLDCFFILHDKGSHYLVEPVGRWYRFCKNKRGGVLDTEEAEQKMLEYQKKNRAVDDKITKMMHTLPREEKNDDESNAPAKKKAKKPVEDEDLFAIKKTAERLHRKKLKRIKTRQGGGGRNESEQFTTAASVTTLKKEGTTHWDWDKDGHFSDDDGDASDPEGAPDEDEWAANPMANDDDDSEEDQNDLQLLDETGQEILLAMKEQADDAIDAARKEAAEEAEHLAQDIANILETNQGGGGEGTAAAVKAIGEVLDRTKTPTMKPVKKISEEQAFKEKVVRLITRRRYRILPMALAKELGLPQDPVAKKTLLQQMVLILKETCTFTKEQEKADEKPQTVFILKDNFDAKAYLQNS
eukprot:GHVL01022751.1.p2 GENE.GHVL01022751.1~~GHVL01022751.1.p2  ORF type:complete len:436 (+),score=131.43 GHVL01022751.1:111-1418(+)